MLEEKEEVLEEWWFKEQQNNKNLQIWFCENKIEGNTYCMYETFVKIFIIVCCPKNTYGPKCKGTYSRTTIIFHVKLLGYRMSRGRGKAV